MLCQNKLLNNNLYRPAENYDVCYFDNVVNSNKKIGSKHYINTKFLFIFMNMKKKNIDQKIIYDAMQSFKKIQGSMVHLEEITALLLLLYRDKLYINHVSK